MKKEVLLLVGLMVFFAGCPDIISPDGNNNGNGDVVLSPPANVKATSKNVAIELSWEAVESSSLKGYNIYRTLNKGKDYGKINSYPVTGINYRDEGLAGGITYYYVVTSETKTGKESNYSLEVSAIPITISDKNAQAPYIELCNKEATQLKKDQCLNDYALQFNDISACREMKELNIDKCIKDIGVNLKSYDTCKEIKLKNVTYRDECFYAIAIALKDTTGCNQIIDSAKSNSCNAVVAASENSIEACKKISVVSDKDICFKAIAISLKDYVVCTYISTATTSEGFERDDCLTTVLNSVKEETLCTFFINQTKKNECFGEIGVKEKNPLICKKSTDLNLTDYCIKNIALEEKDSDYCLQILDKNIFQQCVAGVAEANPEKKACELITDLSTKDNCYYNTAQSSKKETYCPLIIDNSIRDNCYNALAVDLNKGVLCDEIRLLNANLRNSCYSTVAGNSLDSPLCEKITGSEQYISCYNHIAVKLTDYSVCNSADKYFPKLIYATPDYCFYAYAEEKNDELACDQIRNTAYRNSCDVNALSG
ncbi:MAG: fibronectin type III domain-containing protein [archaeon]